MEIRTIKPVTIVYFSTKAKLSELQQFVGTKPDELFRDATNHGLEITGPNYWIYNGMDGNPETTFDLEIAFPVNIKNSYNGSFKIKELPEFKCLSAVHNGSWMNMPNTYGKLIESVFQNGLNMSGICRELYHNVNFIDIEENITEIQLGVI